MKQPLHLVHALELSTHEGEGDHDFRASALGWAGHRLAKLAERARARGAKVEMHVEAGSPDQVLLAAAARVNARLIVVAALGGRRKGSPPLGGHAERLAMGAHVPVLVVRKVESFEAFARGTRPLRILLGADATQSSEQALRWIEALSAVGPCEVTAVHLYWPADQFERLGLQGPRGYSEPAPEVSAALEQSFAARLTERGMPKPAFRSLPHMGRVGDRLARIAQEEGADLIVVGSHGRSGLERIAFGSVSHDVLRCAEVAVACIPVQPDAMRVPELRRILVATDFSDCGNAAVPLASAVAGRAATIHLVHVVPDRSSVRGAVHDIFSPTEAHAQERARLLEMTFPGVDGHPAVAAHVLESNDVAAAICQAAERLDAGMILPRHPRAAVCRRRCWARSHRPWCAARGVRCCSRANRFHELCCAARARTSYGASIAHPRRRRQRAEPGAGPGCARGRRLRRAVRELRRGGDPSVRELAAGLHPARRTHAGDRRSDRLRAHPGAAGRRAIRRSCS